MSKAFITTGATTTHGGVVTEGLPNFTMYGGKVHVEGMKHYCPQCKQEAIAIGSNPTKKAMGKTMILDGDFASCGAQFIACQHNATASGGGIVNSEAFGMINHLSKQTKPYVKQFQLIDEDTKEPLSKVAYRFIANDQIIGQGIADEQGFTEIIESDIPMVVKVQILYQNAE